MNDPSTPQPGTAPLTLAGLARRYGVHRSTVLRVLRAGRAAHDASPATVPPPPAPLNPGEPQLLYDPRTFDVLWQQRRMPGRPSHSDGEAQASAVRS